MNESVSIARAEPARSRSQKTRPVFPREEWSILAALALPAIAALSILQYLPGAAYEIPFLNIRVPLTVIALVVLFCIAFIIGSWMQSRTTRSLESMREWLAAGRTARFVSVPPLPNFDSDAAGDLGREIAASVALFSATSAHNDALGKEKSELLMIAAHQLHTPMTEVRWGLEQLLDPSTPAATKEELGRNIGTSLRRLSAVIDNIIASSDIDTASAKYVFESVDLVPLIEDVVSEFKPFAQECKVDLNFDHATTPPVRADSYRLSTVFYNLLSNAIGYTPAGGKVAITLHQKGQAIECSVADTGIGIPEKDMAMLFSKFHRGEHAKHMRADGSGLGLYLVKNIITQHGSDVVVRSKDGAGTTVSFTLPLANATAIPRA